jgi:acyl-CoA thioester hydrolase
MRVRWAEVDKHVIVFNGHYLMYFDVGITGYYRALAYAYPEDLARHGTDRRGCKSG